MRPAIREAAHAAPSDVPGYKKPVRQSFAERPKRYGFTKLINPENMNVFNSLTFAYRLSLAPVFPSLWV